MIKLAAWGVAAALLAVVAHAGPVYKCEVAPGKFDYRDTPCPAGSGKPVETNFNSIDTAPNPEVTKKARDLDQKIDARLRAEAIVREQNAIAAAAQRRECLQYSDSAIRQQPWLYSQSAVARASAYAEIGIARRRWQEAGCGTWGGP